MKAANALGALAGAAARRPWPVIALATVAGLLAIVGALALRPRADASTLVSSASSEYRQTQVYHRAFGEEPVTVLVQENLEKLLLSSDLARLVGLEGCLSGRIPASALGQVGGRHGPCGRLAASHAVKVVYGPGTFLSEAATQIDQEVERRSTQAQREAKLAGQAVQRAALARGDSEAEALALASSAEKATLASAKAELAALAVQYGITSLPSIANPEFVAAVVFDSSKPGGVPKSRFAYLFPSRDAALISVRLRAGLSEEERSHAIALIREAVAMKSWRLQSGGHYSISGEPVIVSDLTKAITNSIAILLIAVVVVMALALSLVFRGRPRLLPLVLALLAAALTFGLLYVAGGSLTIGTVAVLPILVGLAVDYSIQLLSRVAESEERYPLAARRAVIVEAASRGGPTIVTAAAASAAAILAVLLSPVPMVRSFGLLLVVGLAIALLCALSVGAAALAVRPQQTGRAAARGVRELWRRAGAALTGNPLTRALNRLALGEAVRRPGRVLAVAAVVAALGWGLDTQASVQTDIAQLVPQNLPSIRALTALEHATGVGGQVNVLVAAPNVATPRVIDWMARYEQRVLGRFGYSSARGCTTARLCPFFSLPELFGTGPHTQASINELLATVPPYFTNAVLAPGRRLGTLTFGVRLKGLNQSQQAQVIETMRAELHPPSGVHAEVVGLTALVARTGAQVASPLRRILTLIVAVLAAALVLLIAFRGNLRRVLAPLVPVVLATGWSGLVLYVLGIPLNPMSVLLGPLVVAVATEFSVLLAERHRQERAAGLGPAEALQRAYSRTGAAVGASAATATVGFGVLAFSQIAMLRDFGLVTLVDLTVAVAGVVIALPAALTIADRRGAP